MSNRVSKYIPSNINFFFITLSEQIDTPADTFKPSMSEKLSSVQETLISLQTCISENFKYRSDLQDIREKVIS